MFDKMKALIDMQKKMREVKQRLEDTIFEVESPEGLVKITMNGSQEIKDISIQADITNIQKERLEKAIKDVYNRAIKRSHEIAAEQMNDATGLNLPGLL